MPTRSAWVREGAAVPQPRHRDSLAASLYRDYVSSVVDSCQLKDQGQKARLLYTAVRLGTSELRESGARAATWYRDVLVGRALHESGVKFSASNGAHHVRQTGALLAAVAPAMHARAIQTLELPQSAMIGYSADAKFMLNAAVFCGEAAATIAQLERAKRRALALRRGDFAPLLERANRHATPPLVAARPVLSEWLVADAVFDVCWRRGDEDESSSPPSRHALAQALRSARIRLAILCDVRPGALPLDDCAQSFIPRAIELFAARRTRSSLSVLADAAKRACLYWRLLAAPCNPPSGVATSLSALRSFLSHVAVDAARGTAADNSFNVVCANLGTSRNVSRVVDVFATAEQAHATVVLLQETRLRTAAQLPSLPAGWTAFVAGRSGDDASRGGGVVLAVRQPALCSSDGKLTDVKQGVECVWVRVRVNALREQWFHCASIYVPPSTLGAHERERFLAESDELVRKVRDFVNAGELVLLAGDFNACLRSHPSTHRERLLARLVSVCGLRVANACPTHLAASDDAATLLTVPIDDVEDFVARCPPTHRQQGAQASRIDWVLVSPAFAECVHSFTACMRADTGHATMIVRARVDSLVERFQRKSHPRLHVELLTRNHLPKRFQAQLKRVIDEQDRDKHNEHARVQAQRAIDSAPDAQSRASAILELQLLQVNLDAQRARSSATIGLGVLRPLTKDAFASHTAPPLTTLLSDAVAERLKHMSQQGEGVAAARDTQEAYTRWWRAVSEVSESLLGDVTSEAKKKLPEQKKRGSGGSSELFKCEWWTPSLVDLHKRKLRAGRAYAKLLHKKEKFGDVSERAEQARLELRAAEKQFNTRVSVEKREAFNRLCAHLDDALNYDRRFPDSLWAMLRAIQRKKLAPNGSGALIAVNPSVAASFWRKVWEDARVEDDKIALSELYTHFMQFESVRSSLSPWLASQAPCVYYSLCAPVTGAELFARVHTLSKGKSPGLDQITNDVLRVLPLAAFEEFAYVCNCAIRDRSLPLEWRRSSLKLLPKPNTTGEQPGDYRPICLLSCAFKLFESVLMERFNLWIEYYDYHNERPFICHTQGGFRTKRGTLDQVLHLLFAQQIYTVQHASITHPASHPARAHTPPPTPLHSRAAAAAAAAHHLPASPLAPPPPPPPSPSRAQLQAPPPVQEKKGVLAVFLDITKAFDSVPHGILLQKMLRKGVPVQFVRMCELLLREHFCELDFSGADFEKAACAVDEQCVSIDNQKGAIQGSISGPMFWAIFINDLLENLEWTSEVDSDEGVLLPACVQTLQSSWFADDGGLLKHSVASMQRDLDTCGEWAEKNRIQFSPKKSVAMWLVLPPVGSNERALVGKENLRLHNSLLAFEKKFCYLGIDIDAGDAARGKMTQQCPESKIERAEKRIEHLRCMLRSDHSLSAHLSLQITRAKINSVLLYGCDILEPHTRADVVQRQALRCVLSTYDRTHTYLLYTELGELRISTQAMVMFAAGCARIVASPTPIAPCAAALAREALELPPPSARNSSQIRLIPWQHRLRDVISKLSACDTHTRVPGDDDRIKLSEVFKLGMNVDITRVSTTGGSNRSGASARVNNSDSQREQKNAHVREKLFEIARAEEGAGSDDVMMLRADKAKVSLRFVLMTLLRQAQQAHSAAQQSGLIILAARSRVIEELRVLAKCVKVVARACGRLYEYSWWCSEFRAAKLPLARLPAPGEGQPYLARYSVRHANIAFLVRTGSFNPPDVVKRNGGELMCRLCNEAHGDCPLHLIGVCVGDGTMKMREKLQSMRAELRALVGTQFTDWREAIDGLVAKTRGVSVSALTRERVQEGCELLYRFYCIRRDAAPGRKRTQQSREKDGENVIV